MDSLDKLTTSTIWNIETALNFLREVPDDILMRAVESDAKKGFALDIVLDKMDSFVSRCRILELDE